jgi:hypothetical protein
MSEFAQAYLQWLEAEGHTDAKMIGSRHYACIVKYGYTHGIIRGAIGDYTGYDDRWCYHDHASAKAALAAWDGIGEPAGWHRQPGTGRRLAEDDNCYDGDGNKVPIGQIYVRL